MQQIVSQAMEAFAQSGRNRLRVEGPAVYGAFSNDSGRANVSWVLRGRDPPVVSLRWQESGGPPVTAPTHEGFGSRLIKRSLAEELGGEVDVIYAREGLICTIDFPIHRA